MSHTRLWNPITLRAVAVLMDGPRPRAEVLAEAAFIVPPGRALRRFQVNAPDRKKTSAFSPQGQMASGARWIVLAVLSYYIRKGELLEYERDGVAYYEATPKLQEKFIEQSARQSAILRSGPP